MPILNGMEAARQIVKNCPGTSVLVLSSYTHEECVKQLNIHEAAGLTRYALANGIVEGSKPAMVHESEAKFVLRSTPRYWVAAWPGYSVSQICILRARKMPGG